MPGEEVWPLFERQRGATDEFWAGSDTIWFLLLANLFSFCVLNGLEYWETNSGSMQILIIMVFSICTVL